MRSCNMTDSVIRRRVCPSTRRAEVSLQKAIDEAFVRECYALVVAPTVAYISRPRFIHNGRQPLATLPFGCRRLRRYFVDGPLRCRSWQWNLGLGSRCPFPAELQRLGSG